MLEALKQLFKGKEEAPGQVNTAVVASENEKVLSDMLVLAAKLQDSSQKEEQDNANNQKWIQRLRKEGRGY